MRRAIAIVGVLAFVLAAAGVSYAVPLSDLLNGGSITAGDKLFDNWTYTYDTSDPSRSFNAANIEVTALTGGGLNPGPGLSFFASNNELLVAGDGVYAFVDLMFGFRVSVLDPGYKIKDNSLTLTTADVAPSGDNGSYIMETIGTAPMASNLGTNNVEYSWLDPSFNGPGLIANISSYANFAPQSEVWVTNNILVWASDTTEMAGVGLFEQRFSQVPAGLPEPGMLALLALGGVALLRFKRG